jgi:hypothetical protein
MESLEILGKYDRSDIGIKFRESKISASGACMHLGELPR